MDEYHHRLALHPTGEDDVLYIGLQVAHDAAYAPGKAALRAAGVARDAGNGRTRSATAASWIW